MNTNPQGGSCLGIYWLRPLSRARNTRVVKNGLYDVTVFAWDIDSRASRSAPALPMQEKMLLRPTLVLGAAIALAAVDLAVNAMLSTQAWDFHQRSPAWSAIAASLLVVVLLLAVLPSRLVAAAAGVVAGGALGNLVSAHEDAGGVPNPFVVGSFAFNVADVFILTGVPVLVVALARVLIRHRERIDRLIPPRRWELALRRRLGL